MEACAADQALCRSCGFCCDGTMFASVPLEAADLLAPLQARGIEIQTNETKHSFMQPCGAYADNCCQIYADRPSTCRKFRCELLKKYASGARSWEEAQQTIGRALALREALRAELARIVPDGGQMSVTAVLNIVPTHEALTADRDFLKTWAPVMLRLVALLDCLGRNFHSPRKDGADANT
jgi:Fe-S-cluster containining protein